MTKQEILDKIGSLYASLDYDRDAILAIEDKIERLDDLLEEIGDDK